MGRLQGERGSILAWGAPTATLHPQQEQRGPASRLKRGVQTPPGLTALPLIRAVQAVLAPVAHGARLHTAQHLAGELALGAQEPGQRRPCQGGGHVAPGHCRKRWGLGSRGSRPSPHSPTPGPLGMCLLLWPHARGQHRCAADIPKTAAAGARGAVVAAGLFRQGGFEGQWWGPPHPGQLPPRLGTKPHPCLPGRVVASPGQPGMEDPVSIPGIPRSPADTVTAAMAGGVVPGRRGVPGEVTCAQGSPGVPGAPVVGMGVLSPGTTALGGSVAPGLMLASAGAPVCSGFSRSPGVPAGVPGKGLWMAAAGTVVSSGSAVGPAQDVLQPRVASDPHLTPQHLVSETGVRGWESTSPSSPPGSHANAPDCILQNSPSGALLLPPLTSRGHWLARGLGLTALVGYAGHPSWSPRGCWGWL